MMSNKLKTVSKSQLETLISEALSDYLEEEVHCDVQFTDVPNIDDEDKLEYGNKRTVNFKAHLAYEESEGF
jgi:hypothetical protein